jgi:hypothetical protein
MCHLLGYLLLQTFRDAAGAVLPEVNVKRSVQDISGAANDAVSISDY